EPSDAGRGDLGIVDRLHARRGGGRHPDRRLRGLRLRQVGGRGRGVREGAGEWADRRADGGRRVPGQGARQQLL
ncbi:MAG: hypothetical protein AVDCRST_MAG64-3449, partial [uncultured Phycisphaerae bacterium]